MNRGGPRLFVTLPVPSLLSRVNHMPTVVLSGAYSATEVIPAVSGKRIVIFGVSVTASDGTSFTLQTNAPVALDSVALPGGHAWHYRDSEMSTIRGASVTATSDAASVRGHIMYEYL